MAALSPLAAYPATFFTLVSVSNNTITNAVRASRDFFISIEQFLTSGNNKALKMENIYPILPTDELLPCFPGLKIVPIQANEKTEKKAQVVMELWKLNQVGKILDTRQAFDKSWLLEIKDSSQRKITTCLAEAKIDKEGEFTTWVNNTLGSNRTKSENDFLHKIIEIAQEQAANNTPSS